MTVETVDDDEFCEWLEQGGFQAASLSDAQWRTLNDLFRRRLSPSPRVGVRPRISPILLVPALVTGLLLGWLAPRFSTEAATTWSRAATAGPLDDAADRKPAPSATLEIARLKKQCAALQAKLEKQRKATSPSEPAGQAPLSIPEQAARVVWVTPSGNRLQLKGGTLWETSPEAREIVANWNEGERITVTREDGSPWPYVLFNEERTEVTPARRLD